LLFIILSYSPDPVRFDGLTQVWRCFIFWTFFIDFFLFQPFKFGLLKIDHCYFFQFVCYEVDSATQSKLQVWYPNLDWLETVFFFCLLSLCYHGIQLCNFFFFWQTFFSIIIIMIFSFKIWSIYYLSFLYYIIEWTWIFFSFFK